MPPQVEAGRSSSGRTVSAAAADLAVLAQDPRLWRGGAALTEAILGAARDVGRQMTLLYPSQLLDPNDFPNTATLARALMDRDVSTSKSMSAHRCCTAWNDPMGRPYCSRCCA